MISSVFIERILSQTCAIFQGVYPADHIPSNTLKKLKEFCIIVNLSELSFPGTHFVAIYKTKHQITYFDSGGSPCFIPEICTFMRSFNLPVKSIHTKIQSNTSMFCAFYTILFCLVHNKIKDYNFYTRKSLLLRNDNRVIKYITRALKSTSV